MPTYQAEQLLQNLQQQTETFINEAVTHWQMMPHEQFAYKASVEQWSANQCLQHLNSYGLYYLPAIEKGMLAAKAGKNKPVATFLSGWLGNYLTRLMQPKEDGSVGKKMKSPKAHQPQNNADSYAVVAEFMEQQERLLVLLEKANQLDLDRIRIPISIAPFIKLKLGDVFLFMVAHNQRHVWQAKKALETIL